MQLLMMMTIKTGKKCRIPWNMVKICVKNVILLQISDPFVLKYQYHTHLCKKKMEISI